MSTSTPGARSRAATARRGPAAAASSTGGGGGLANLHTGEIHDLSRIQTNCQLGEIKHHRPYDTVPAGLAAGFDPCDYCLPQVLHAHIKAFPRPIRRGAQLTLDATASKPQQGAARVVDYQWRITPAGQPATVVTPTTPRLTFTLLGDITIHLRVSNAAGEHDEQETTVTCLPRGGHKSDWHRKIKWRPAVSGGVLHEKLVTDSLSFGRNVCIAELTAESSGHIIHHDSERPTWNDSGYTTTQVQDDGPFNGCWYISGHTLYIGRAELRSSDLSAGSDLYRTNVRAGRRADIAALAQSVAEHEHAHTSVLYKIFNRHGAEPVTALESMVRTDKTTLIRDADTAIMKLDTLLQGDSNHEAEVHQQLRAKWGGRSVTILIHEIGDPPTYTTLTLPDLSQVGETAG